MEKHYDVIVIGGGASGMMAAGVAGARGKKVLLLEKNERLGEKLRISGGGRCNITNAEEDVRVLLKNYGDAEQFLYSSFSQFGMKDTFSFFEKLGLPLVVQARNRAFPHTEKAGDVVKVMTKYLKDNKVEVETATKVSRIVTEKGKVMSVVCGKNTYTADSFIVATGGVSHPETGSTGDGFNWLKALGHRVEKPTPTIVPLSVKESWVHALSGKSLTFMKITFFKDGNKSFSKTGKILFTHFGLSGPLILNSAGAVGDLLQDGLVTATIDSYPDTTEKDLENKIIKIFDTNKNKNLKNVLDEIMPHGTADVFPQIFRSIDIETKVHSVTKDERKTMVKTLKALPITITGLMGFDRAVVADGGVTLTEIDTKTMKSKLFKNLFITGDLLHITRPSGGYSLQLCWTTGFVAGSSV